MKEWIKPIKKFGACTDALEWGEQFETMKEAWEKCDRGDWMLWILGQLSGKLNSDSRKKLVLVVCQCARLALPYVPQGEERPLQAIVTTERWARGEDDITLNDVRTAANATANAAAYAAAYAAYAAANATAYAAANAAAYAAAYAAYAANATAYAANATAYAANAARLSLLKECADIVRRVYPELPKIKESR